MRVLVFLTIFLSLYALLVTPLAVQELRRRTVVWALRQPEAEALKEAELTSLLSSTPLTEQLQVKKEILPVYKASKNDKVLK